MTLAICSHGYTQLRKRGILPGQADEIVDSPSWSGIRADGTRVFARDGIAVVVKDKTIVTAYRLK